MRIRKLPFRIVPSQSYKYDEILFTCPGAGAQDLSTHQISLDRLVARPSAIRAQLLENHVPGRTKKLIFRFNNTFSFDGSNRMFPPGDYSVLEDEELIEGISWLAYRRKATFIQIPAIGTVGPLTQLLEIDHDELTAIIDQDAQNGTSHTQRNQNHTGGKT
jgi:hypothetical protein